MLLQGCFSSPRTRIWGQIWKIQKCWLTILKNFIELFDLHECHNKVGFRVLEYKFEVKINKFQNLTWNLENLIKQVDFR